MQQYKITFGVALNEEKLYAIERDFGIPAHFDTIYIEANSPRHAIRLFCEKYALLYAKTFKISGLEDAVS